MRILLFLILLQSSFGFGQNAPVLNVNWNGNYIQLSGVFPQTISEVTIKLTSNRNDSISKITTISKFHPEPNKVLPKPLLNREIWYPVADLRMNVGMVAELTLNEQPKLWSLNNHFHKQIFPNQQIITVEGNQLEDWENSLYVEPSTVSIKQFSYVQTMPVIAGRLNFLIEPLSENWFGIAEISYLENSQQKIIKHAINLTKAVKEVVNKPIYDKYRKAFVNCVEYIIKSQNRNPNSPVYGSLNIFYDVEAQTYRSNYWLWGSGPAVKVLLEAAKMKELSCSKSGEELTQIADEIGQATLLSRMMDKQHPVYGVPISRWRRDYNIPDFGYQLCYATSDANFLSGWAWLPLYEATKKAEYLDAAKLLATTTDTLMKKYGIIPQDFYYKENAFSLHTIDESGFGTEGLSKLYEVTKNPYYKELTDRYMQEHLKKMSRPDGIWERGWHQKTGIQPTIKMTRGLGWAMEGLLASHRANPEGGYLVMAKKMADKMCVWQTDKGYWVFIADGDVKKVGIGEKGTALWSYLMYKLYHETKDKKYLTTARKALNWCVENQYQGTDIQAQGGIVGLTSHSAVGATFRPWFPVICTYTSAFFALALLEEMQL